jgi:excisionase family DNA binding protein
VFFPAAPGAVERLDPAVVCGVQAALPRLQALSLEMRDLGPGVLVHLDVQVPVFAARLMLEACRALADGNAAVIVSVPAELTTQQAADMLNVSRPFVIKLLDGGQVPFRRVGNRRKVLLDDLLRYKSADDVRRKAVLDELSREAQEIGITY